MLPKMDTWINLCRCCLSPESEVSLFDKDRNVKDKFLEITSIEVKSDDGLPQKLCTDCFSIMNSAYQFKKQCIKMDIELKVQLKSILKAENDKSSLLNSIGKETDLNDLSYEDNPMKQLEAIIKTEPNDNDEDYYYVLVIDDPKEDEQVEELNQFKIKEEPDNDVQESFEKSIDSFLVTGPKIPANVPATILQNEDEDEEDENNFEAMNVDEGGNEIMNQDNEISQEKANLIAQVESSQDTIDEVQTIAADLINSSVSDSKNSYIKILTTTAGDGKILLKSADNVTYLTDTQLVDAEDGNQHSQEEVIVYEDDDSSQFQIVKCDGELVIEYADDSEISTVLQQEDGTFLCDCGEQFEEFTDYQKHQLTHNPAADHLCNLCGKGFESSEILTGHMLLHNVTGLFIMCPFCNQLIKRNALTQHIKYGHNNIKPRCKVCLKTFANPNNLKRHMMIHSGIRQFECDICFKRFHQKITMQTHRLTHIDPFSCGQCDKSFQSKTELEHHKQGTECTKSKIAKIRDELIRTVKQEITTQQGKLLGYACSLCKKMFSLESALEQHVDSTHMLDPMELLCSDCGEVLPSKKDMQSHILTHRNVKNKNLKRFECGICGKGCSSQAMLIMHERVHTNERPFPCQLCALRFKTKTHLRTHQLTHTREKKFGCSVCMKFFALKGNLVVHLRTHTGERPYVCNLCGEAFIDSKYLKKHKLKKHAIDNMPWNKY